MAAVSLATLRTRARERADMPVAGFIPDTATGIDAFVNEGVQRLHEMLVEAYDSNYFKKSQTFTTFGAETVTLPTDFYKLLGVDLTYGSITQTVQPFARGMRNVYKNLGSSTPWGPAVHYSLQGPSTLRLLPAPPAGTPGTFWYVPVATPLVLTTDTVDFPNGWERYVVLYTAIQMKLKQEDDVRDLRYELEKMEAELRLIADRRDLASPAHAVDMDAVDTADLRWWLP
jgi:hypothetical protein